MLLFIFEPFSKNNLIIFKSLESIVSFNGHSSYDLN